MQSRCATCKHAVLKTLARYVADIGDNGARSLTLKFC